MVREKIVAPFGQRARFGGSFHKVSPSLQPLLLFIPTLTAQ